MSRADYLKDSIAGIVVVLLLYGICTLGGAASPYEPSKDSETVMAQAHP